MSDATSRPTTDDDRPTGEASAKLDNLRPADPDAAPDPDEIVVEDDSPTEPAAHSTPTSGPSSPLGGERVVYRDAPIPPKPQSNRLAGTLLAFAGALLFIVVYALFGAAAAAVEPEAFGGGFGGFVSDYAFWVPVLFFTLGFVLEVLLLNTAAWWAHVLGSLLVAALVYLGTVGVALLLNLATDANPGAGFGTFALAPFVLVASAIAREVSIWTGLLIARRGGRLKERNAEARAAFEQEHGTGAPDARPATAAA